MSSPAGLRDPALENPEACVRNGPCDSGGPSSWANHANERKRLTRIVVRGDYIQEKKSTLTLGRGISGLRENI